MRSGSALVLVALGCAASPQASEPKKAEVTPAASAPASDAPLVATESDPALLSGTPRRRARFAPSPITEFSEKVVELVMAVLDQGPLPSDFPLATQPPGTRLIGLVGLDHEEARRIDWFALAPELDFSVTTREGKNANIRGVYLLTEAGLHLVDVSKGDMKRRQQLPAWASGFEAVAVDLLETARRGKLPSLFPGDEVRRLFNDDRFWDEAMRSLPRSEGLAEVQAVAQAATSGPVAYRLDDIELAGRTSSGRLCGCKLEFDEQDGRLVLNPRLTLRIVKSSSEVEP